MLIDWFTVGAQAINFLILVWLLKRFLYKPILHAIDEREKRIAAELANADEQKAAAQQEREEFQHKNEEFEQQRAALLSKVTDEVKVERQRLLDEARAAADALRAKRQDALQQEQQSLNDEITRRTQAEVFAIARKTLTDLSGTSFDERASEVFTRRLRELDGDEKDHLATALKASSEPVLVRSAFELPAEQRMAIEHALHETFSAEIQIRFETAPQVIGGIELTTNGRKVAWSIADYLSNLENHVGELLHEPSNSSAKPEVKPPVKPQVKPESKSNIKPQSGTKPAVPAETP